MVARPRPDERGDIVTEAPPRGGVAGALASPSDGFVKVRLLRLRWSNAYFLVGDRVVLVDAGSPGDEAAILAAAASLGRGAGALAAIVLTHGHADHAGAAAAVRAATGAPILLAAGDVAMAGAGRNVPLVPKGHEARLVKPFVPQAFPAFVPDEVLDAPRDLSPFGVSGLVRPLGGHTRGPAIVEVPGGDVLVGDLLRGGRLGGRWRGTTPMTHYYEAPLSPLTVTPAVEAGSPEEMNESQVCAANPASMAADPLGAIDSVPGATDSTGATLSSADCAATGLTSRNAGPDRNDHSQTATASHGIHWATTRWLTTLDNIHTLPRRDGSSDCPRPERIDAPVPRSSPVVTGTTNRQIGCPAAT